MLYFFYPDESIKLFETWEGTPEKSIAGTIVYEPNDEIHPWIIYTNNRGGIIDKDIRTLPTWIKVYQLLID